MNEYFFDPLFNPSTHGVGMRAGDGPVAVSVTHASEEVRKDEERPSQEAASVEGDVSESDPFRYDYALRLKHNLLLAGVVLYVYFRYRRVRSERDRRSVRFSGVVGVGSGSGVAEEERRRDGHGRDCSKQAVRSIVRRRRPTRMGDRCDDDSSLGGSVSFSGTGHGISQRAWVAKEEQSKAAARQIQPVPRRPTPSGVGLNTDAPTTDVDAAEDCSAAVPLCGNTAARHKEEKPEPPSRGLEESSVVEDCHEHGRVDECEADEKCSSPVGDQPEGEGDSDVSDWTVIEGEPSTEARGWTSSISKKVSSTASAGQLCSEEPIEQSAQRHVSQRDLSAFHAWHDEICSSYRILSIGLRRGDGETEIQMQPVRRANELRSTPVVLRIRNRMQPLAIDVFEVSPASKEIHIASISPGATWTHRTFIGRPFILREPDNGTPLLYYVALRIVPTTMRAPTIDDLRHPGVGVNDVTVHPPHPSSSEDDSSSTCRVYDPVLPNPSTEIDTVSDAIEWCCRQHEREGATSPDLLLRYLCNILRHPTERRYRRIQTANAAFRDGVWDGPGRGVLLALGFREIGDHMELGAGESSSSSSPPDDDSKTGTAQPLSDGLMRDVSDATFRLARCKSDMLSSVVARRQPQGACER